MSTHSYFQKNCWSCIFFSGRRDVKGGFYGYVETSNWGICTNQKCFHANDEVSDGYSCSYYQQCGGLIATQEQKRAKEQAEREQKRATEQAERKQEQIAREQRQFYEQQERENPRQQEALRAERFRLEEERKRLEYERWYNSLTPEKRKQEDDRKEQERIKAEELRKQREEENKTKREKEEKQQKLNKKFQLIWALVGLALFFTIIYLIFAFSSLDYYKTLYNIETYDGFADRISEYTIKCIIGTVLCVLEILAIIITAVMYKRKKI